MYGQVPGSSLGCVSEWTYNLSLYLYLSLYLQWLKQCGAHMWSTIHLVFCFAELAFPINPCAQAEVPPLDLDLASITIEEAEADKNEVFSENGESEVCF